MTCVSSQIGSRHLPLKQGIVSSSLTWRTNLKFRIADFELCASHRKGTLDFQFEFRNSQSEILRFQLFFRKEEEHALRKANHRRCSPGHSFLGQSRIQHRRAIDAAQCFALAMFVQARRADARRAPGQRQHGRLGRRDEGSSDSRNRRRGHRLRHDGREDAVQERHSRRQVERAAPGYRRRNSRRL